MKFTILPIAGLLAMASAHGQNTVKPGTINPLIFEATITTENTPTETNLPGGAKRKKYTTSAVRFGNRDILEAMRVASLLDGTLTGWVLYRAAGANGAGNLYALKAGKTAVAVPANLLTHPANQGTASTGTEVVPATGTGRPNLKRKVYATLNVRAGASSATGTQVLNSAVVNTGGNGTVVITQTDSLTVQGRSGTGTGILTGKYRTQRARIVNLTPFFPGSTVP